jgi:hypothetical protein
MDGSGEGVRGFGVSMKGASSLNVNRLGHLALPGAGQVSVAGRYAYVGHIPNKGDLGTSIIDISDPRHPKLVATVPVGDPASHSHKVRVVGDLMIVNHERNNTPIGRRADELPGARRSLAETLRREPTLAEIAAKMQVTEKDLVAIAEAERRGYADGGFRVYDVSNPAKPRFIAHHKTGGIGVHRFDMDERYAYISTEIEGFVGNILVIFDISNPEKPAEVSRWWLPGQNRSAGEMPSWPGRQHRLHHALRFGNEMWASCWHGGFAAIDISNIQEPKTLGSYNYHPLFPEHTHTVMPIPGRIGGRRIAVAIDEEDHVLSAMEENARRGRMHAGMLAFDVSDLSKVKPLSFFEVSELDSPYARTSGARFGAHQCYEKADGTLVYAVWFSAGLRIVDLADPFAPREVGHFIPEPVAGLSAPQSNDVTLDERGIIFMVDRLKGFDILEFARG